MAVIGSSIAGMDVLEQAGLCQTCADGSAAIGLHGVDLGVVQAQKGFTNHVVAAMSASTCTGAGTWGKSKKDESSWLCDWYHLVSLILRVRPPFRTCSYWYEFSLGKSAILSMVCERNREVSERTL